MLLVSHMVIVGLVQSSVVLIHQGATAHTLDWYEDDDDLEGVRFNYKIQEDLAQDGHPIQYSPFTSSSWHAPSDISSQSSAQPPPGGTQAGVAFPPAFSFAAQEPTVSRSESISSSSTVAAANHFNNGLGVTFGEFPSFNRIFTPQNSISKYDYDSKEDKDSFHTIHKSVTSSSPTMSISIVRRVGSYEHAPINIFDFGFGKSVSTTVSRDIITPAPATPAFSRRFEVEPVNVEEFNDDSAEKNTFSIKQEPQRNYEEKVISFPARSKFVPTLALLKPATASPPVTNLRYQLRQQQSSAEEFGSSFVSSTQAPILAAYNPVFDTANNVEEVEPTKIQVKASDDADDNSESKESVSPAFTRSKQQPGIESKFAALTLKRQSKPLSRFRYQHVLALSREDD